VENKRVKAIGKFNARAMLIIIGLIMAISLGFSVPTAAMDDNVYESKDKTNFYVKLIGECVSALKPAENSDDTKFIGNFTLNPLEIIRSEISFLDEGNLKDQTAIEKVKEHAKEVKEIAINPFQLKDTDINKIDQSVDVVGNPEDNSQKRILIYHTHTNESYAEGNNGLSTSVAAVGDELTAQLETLGFTVIHDKTVHDTDYNAAYEKSKVTLTNHLKTYGDFNLIIDLHRDAVDDKSAVTCSINNESLAKVMFVTTDLDPRHDAHIANLNSIIETANSLYPGLIRDRKIFTYPSGIDYYSQDLSDNAILMEVGANTNELQEAKNSMKYMSRVFAKYLNSK